MKNDTKVPPGMCSPILLLAAGIVLLAGAPASAAEPVAGLIKTSKGSASIERGGQKLPASVGAAIEARDRIVTGTDGVVGITLRDHTMLTAGPNSVLDLAAYAFDDTTHAGKLEARVGKGTLAVISGKLAKTNPQAVSFATPSMTLGVRGTEFVIETGGAEK